MAEGSRRINVNVKTPKEKQVIEVDEDSEVKEVSRWKWLGENLAQNCSNMSQKLYLLFNVLIASNYTSRKLMDDVKINLYCFSNTEKK